ncbi:MAG: hypothetical protein Q9164_001643 [Protoblastenia rupestris]
MGRDRSSSDPVTETRAAVLREQRQNEYVEYMRAYRAAKGENEPKRQEVEVHVSEELQYRSWRPEAAFLEPLLLAESDLSHEAQGTTAKRNMFTEDLEATMDSTTTPYPLASTDSLVGLGEYDLKLNIEDDGDLKEDVVRHLFSKHSIMDMALEEDKAWMNESHRSGSIPLSMTKMTSRVIAEITSFTEDDFQTFRRKSRAEQCQILGDYFDTVFWNILRFTKEFPCTETTLERTSETRDMDNDWWDDVDWDAE